MKPLMLGKTAVLVVMASMVVGCGDGDSDASPTPIATSTTTATISTTATAAPTTSPSVSSTPTASPASGPTATPEPPLPTPTSLAQNEPVLSIVGGGETLQPTGLEFRAWAETTIEAGGASYTGVTLAEIAEDLGVSGGFVEVEGVRSDGARYAIGRFALDEVADTSILVISRTGHVDFVSSTLDSSQWLTFVTAVTFT